MSGLLEKGFAADYKNDPRRSQRFRGILRPAAFWSPRTFRFPSGKGFSRIRWWRRPSIVSITAG